MNRVIWITSFLLLAQTAFASTPEPGSPLSRKCEPKIFFLLGMSSWVRTAGAWEVFSPREELAAAAYERVAHSLAVELELPDSTQNIPGSRSWRDGFVKYIDQYYSKSPDGDSGILFLNPTRFLLSAHRSSSRDAFLAGAFFRYNGPSGLSIPSAEKAIAVAQLISRRTDRGVIVRTYVGYTPGGSRLEFEFNVPLREIVASAQMYVSGNPIVEAATDQQSLTIRKYHVVYERLSKSGASTSDVRHELAYRLDTSEQGAIVSAEESGERLDIDVVVRDASGGLSVINGALAAMDVLRLSKVSEDVHDR